MQNDYPAGGNDQNGQPSKSREWNVKNHGSFSFRKIKQPRFVMLKRILILLFFIVFSAGVGVGLGVFLTYLGEIPLVSDLKAYKPSLSTKIFDGKGLMITELFSEKRTLVSLDDVPLHLQNAIIAIEDNKFYHHIGVDFIGVIRSSIVNLVKGEYSQGFSTITMQLPRNMFLTKKKTIERKIKEIILAFQIERTYTKREILEMYLNQIYLGSGAYGVEAASLKYFGKHVSNLTLPESALLAGLPRSPNAYNPYRNPEKAIQRRNLVLTQMNRLGFITLQEMVDAKMTALELSTGEDSEAPYFIEYVRRQLEEKYGFNAIYQSGLRVYTSLDLDLQRLAQKAMAEGIVEAEKIIVPNLPTIAGQAPETLQCALVLIEPASGEIKAMIGGRNFKESKFIRTVQAQRQPGSAFKPFIYTTAFANGFTQADIILDTPVVFKDETGEVWKPENFSNKFSGPTTLRTALTQSRNVVTVKLLDKVGVKNVIQQTKKFGIQSPLKPYLTLALGASEVNLMELVSAFGVFPNHGVRVEPVSILRVESNTGEVLEENTPYHQEVLDPAVAAIMTNLLENVVNHGTGYGVRRLGFKYPAGGKTGTTNDYSDAWFIGFTTEYVAGVWIGLDSHKSMGRGITGGRVACPIWTKLMLEIYADRAPKNFIYPESVELVKFCNVTGLLPNPGCKVVTGAFAIGTAPTQPCDVHTGAGAENPADIYNLNLSPDLVDFEGVTETAEPEETQELPRHPGTIPTVSPATDPDRPPMF
ncbi:PBP1A family penicillin-binding protein [candidate division FCPU426 bacterium]|nr:PBP1A family penicillin-binding protein [candidate division FCPU426 bacterium]